MFFWGPIYNYIIKLLYGDEENKEEIEEEKEEEEVDECCICLEILDKPIMELECGHKTHTHCGIYWLHNNASCPLCRDKVDTSRPEKAPEISEEESSSSEEESSEEENNTITNYNGSTLVSSNTGTIIGTDAVSISESPSGIICIGGGGPRMPTGVVTTISTINNVTPTSVTIGYTPPPSAIGYIGRGIPRSNYTHPRVQIQPRFTRSGGYATAATAYSNRTGPGEWDNTWNKIEL